MTDPIKDLIENLKKKGVNVDENNIRASLTNQKSASEFYKQNESELGVDKDYFMSFVNTPTRFEVEHENANRQLRNTERDYQRLQNKLRDEAEKGIQSADQLFSDVEVLEKRRNDLQQTVAKLNEKARTKSRFDLEQEFEPSEFESAIVSSKLDKDVIKSNKSTKAFITEESDKLVPFLSDQEKEVYAPIKQIQLEEDSNTSLKQMVDNLSSKKRTQSEEMQFVAAKNALDNSNKKIDELKGFYQRKKTEIESSATEFIKQKKAEKTAIINTLLPEGIKDEDLVQKMIADDPELDKKIRQIDKDIDYANTKIGGFLTQPKAVLSDKEDLLNRIDYLLPGISADPLTKVKAYAVAKNRILQDLKNTLGNAEKADAITAKEYASIPEKMIAIEEELAELAPIALLNRSNSADVQKYSDSIYKNIGVALKNSGIAIASGILGIDAKYDSPKIQAEIIEKSLNIIGEKQNVRPDIYDQTFGNPFEASELFDENQRLLNDRVFKDTKNGQIEYWKSNKSREKYYSNLKEIESKRGELNQSDGFYSGLEMAGLSFKIGVDLFLSSVLVETGIGVGVGTAKALTTVKNIEKIRGVINKNKVVKATFENLKGIKDTGNYTRGQKILSDALAESVKWEVASQVVGGKAWDNTGGSEGFLGGAASAVLEQAVPKPIIGLLSGPGKSKLRDFALKFAGQLPVEYVQENAEQFATTVKESTGSSNFLTGAAEVIANGLQGGEKWESIKEDFSKTMGWEAQKEMAYATAFLSTMFATGSGMGEVFKNMYLDNGGDAKMLEDMSFYLNGVKKIVYDRNTYHYTGERWVDKNKKEVAPEIAAKLNEASPNTKLGDVKELESIASFVKGEWVSENGTKLEGDSLDKIIHGFRGLEEQESVVSDYKTKDVKIAEIEKDEKLTDEEKSQNIQAIPEDNFIQSDEDVIEAKQGQVLYTKNNSVFYTTKQEGSKAVSLSSDSNLVKFEDGKYYIEQKSPIEGSYEVTSGSEFRLAQAIKAANTRQGRALRTVRAFIPITKAIKKSVNGKLQGLKIVLHDGESYSKLDKGSRGHYDKASHTVHLNLSSSLGVTANHEILHPFFNAIFDATPNAKDLFYSQVSQEYKDRYQDVDEAIVEYASDRIVYAATPKLDTDPNFFARIFNNARDIVSRFAGRDAMPLDTDLNSLIGAMAQVGTQRGNNPIIKYLEGLSNKEVDTGSQKTWTERAMSILGIPNATVNGIPYSNEDISRQLEEGLDKTISKIKDTFKKIEGFDYEASELASEHISDSAKEWVDYLENSNAPIEFRALLAAELFEYKYDGTYKERNGGIFDEFNEKHIKEVLQEGKKEGLLKQLYDKKQAAIQQQKIEDEKPRVISGDQSPRDRTRWDPSRGNQTLEGAPIIEGATGADPEITSIAEEYAINNGIPFKRQEKYVYVDIDRATRIADEYENMAHDPENPEVSEAYNELVSQVIDQYKALEQAGYKFYFFDEENDPYDSNPYNAMRDLRQNKTMGVFATEAGYGEGQNNIVSDNNPMLKDTGIEWTYGPDGEKKRVLVNDLFRAIHDVFGHGLEGSGFRAKGEENAFQSHVRLFYGKAVGALATETRGQNSWVNFGKHGEHNRKASANDTIFAEQKIGLMPEWTWTEGVDDFKVDPSTIQQQKIEDENTISEQLRKEQEQERERSGGKDTVEEYTDQLSKIKNYAAEVISNRAEIQRLSKEDERGRIEGGIRNVEATILLAASGRESGQIKGREEQQRAIEDYAKAEGIWYDNIDANPDIGTIQNGLGKYKDSGMENQVYIPIDNPNIVRKTMKTTDPTNKDNDNEVLYHLDTRISAHNAGIGSTAPYTVIGFGRLSNGDFVVISEQPHIQDARMATREEISDEMQKMGYDLDGKDSFSDQDHFITDINPKNVLVSKEGTFHFIDTIYDIFNVNDEDSNRLSGIIQRQKIEDKSPLADIVNGFYSNTENALLQVPQEKMSGSKWKSQLLSRGANSDEMKWTTLLNYLEDNKDKSVSKNDIRQYLKDNRIQVVEVVKDGGISEEEIDTLLNDEVGQDMTRDEARAFLENDERQDDTKFSQYQLEGEKENYKEYYLILPREGKMGEVADWRVPSAHLSGDEFVDNRQIVRLRMNTRIDSEGKKVLFIEEHQADKGQEGRKNGFAEPFKESDIDVQTISKNAVILDKKAKNGDFIIGSKDGIYEYSSAKTIEEAEKELKDVNKPYYKLWVGDNLIGEGYDKQHAIKLALKNQDSPSKDPFSTETANWVKLGLKVALKEAVKQGADKIAWTTGEQQNDRYDLQKQVDFIDVFTNDDGTYHIEAVKGNETISKEKSLKAEQLEGLLGKDLASKIIEDTKSHTHKEGEENLVKTYRGKDLSVGGKGMKGFYGSPTEGSLGIVGNVAKSLFKQEPKTVTIKGGKGSIDATSVDAIWVEYNGIILPENKREDYKFNDNEFVFTIDNNVAYRLYDKNDIKDAKNRDVYTIPRGNYFTQHSIDITPELKAETQQGLPMFQKIEDLPRFNQRQITDEFIDEDWDTWTSAITLISAKDSYVNALAIIDEIIAKRKYQNDDDELNDLLDDIIDFDNSDFRSHPTAVLYNNALQNNYIRFALTARAQSLYEKSTNDETKKLAKYIIGMSRLEMGDIARDAALSLTSFNANIVPTDKGIMSLFLPANANTDKVNKKNSYKESGEQRTDIEEAKFVRDETKKRILEHLEESGNIDDVINRLLDKIESGQISPPIGLPSPKNTIDVDKKTWAKNKSDKYVSKGLDLIKNGLSHFKKLGVVPDPQGDAEAIFDIFKGSVYIALGKLLKAKQIFSEIASELGISPEKEWDKYAESEIGKAHIAEVKRTAAIDKLKKISPKTGVKEARDHFDEFFDRLRASRNKNSKRIIKNIQQKISELGENTRLNEEEVKLIEDAIIILESENYDTEAAGYEARVGKIDELQEMLDALSSKESTNPLSQETRRRRKVREIVKDSLGGKRALLKEIIADFIKYGSARSTLSELLADVLPIDQAKELEKEVFEELDKMLEESSEAISKEEKKNREATIKDLSNKLSSLQENNREIEMIRGELSKLENSEDSSSKSRQMAELSDRLERLTGEKIDKNKTKQELLSDAKKELNELSSRDNLTDEEKLHKKHLLSHIKLLESNAELDAVIADLNRSIKETSKSQKKEQGTKKTVSNLIDKLNKIKEGTYTARTNKEVETTEEIKQLRKQIQELSGARSKLKSLTDRWNPEALLKAIKMGAHDLTDFFAILEDSTDFNFTPKQKKLLYHIHTLVRSSITGQNGHVQNLAATNKAIAMLRNLKSQTNKDVLKRFLYSMASEWAYDSMLSHPSSTINSLLGSVSGYSRIIVEAITRLLKPSDRKAAFKIIKSVWGDFLDSASKAIGLFFSQRSEMALNDLENGFMASGVIDRIWRDKFKDIAKSDSGIVKKVAKIIIKLAVAPVKLMMNIFSATDVFSRNMFRSWNEKWDVYDKVVSKRTESGLDILNAINEELGLKQEVYDQANKEADDLGYTLIRKREYVAKRVLELREQFINDYILVAHADHAARKVMLINNPETSVGASFYSRVNKLNKNENDASYVSLVLMAIKNQIIPFSRNLVNFSHKHLVNTTIPISMVAAGMGKKAEIVTRQSLVANLLTQQYDNYRKTIESKQEYDEMYYRYKSMDENSPEAKSLKRRLDEFIIGGVPVFRNGKIEKEIYTKRDLLLDALESAIGYSTALMIFMSYDDDETEQGIVAKKPNWLRVTGSAHGLTYAEKDAANYTPFSIQVKSDDGWNTVLKWPYVFAHPVFFYLGSMTDKNYDKNTNYGLQESSVAEILYHLASSPLSQGSQQGLQTIADATLFVSKEDSSEETLEKLWKSLVTNTARQSVTPGAYVFMSELNRWFTNQTVMTSDDPFKNQLSKMPFLDGLADKTKLSPFGYPYTQPIPIKLAEYFFEDNGQENELTNINKYLVENSVNGVLKYYNSGSNISDDLQGDILIKGFPEEKQFELRDAVASAYGRIVAESNIYNDTKDYKKDYVTSKKALQQTFQKYYEEAIKEGKDLVLREYVMGIATEELEKETYPEKNGKQLLKFVKSKEDITTAMKEWGIRIDDGKIKYIDKMMSPVEIY